MKTLAPFVIVCLGLLGLVVWELAPVGREPPTDAQLPLRENPLQPLSANVSLSSEITETSDQPASPDDALRPGAQKPAKNQQSRPTEPAPQIPSREPPTDPTVAAQPAVRWAADVRQQREKQRFIGLREILVSDPHNEAALEAALELARQLGWHDEACDLLGRLVRLRGDAAALRFELATLLMRLERWLEAIPQLRSVVERQPENARAWYNLAIAHQALGHLRDARVTWERVIQLMPENPDAYAHRGELLLDLGAWSAAGADFETALRLEPGSIDAAMNLSLALFKLGRIVEARQTLLPFLKQHPQHVPVLNRLARIAWALYEADPVAHEALADEAVNSCLRSLAVDADQPELKALLERASQAGN